jgi:predicted permease
MTNFILIFICLVSGMLLRSGLPAGSHKSINKWILYIALPAVSLKYIPYIKWNSQMFFPLISPVIVWLGAYLFISVYCKIKQINQINRGTLILTCGLSNTSFLGFPLVAAYFGESELSTAIICDQINFILFSILGLLVAIAASGKEKPKISELISKVIKFPPFIGFFAALIIPFFIDLTSFNPLFDRLAGTVAPLALFSIGLQLKFGLWKNEINLLSAGIFYKLLIAPLLVLLMSLAFQLKGPVAQVSIFEAAMPSLVTSFVVIEEYQLNTSLGNLMIGLGIVLAFFSTAVWWLILQII